MRPWLERGEVEQLRDLDARMSVLPVSPQVNSPRYNAEDCIAPLVGEVTET